MQRDLDDVLAEIKVIVRRHDAVAPGRLHRAMPEWSLAR
jgi:hypothetical protein